MKAPSVGAGISKPPFLSVSSPMLCQRNEDYTEEMGGGHGWGAGAHLFGGSNDTNCFNHFKMLLAEFPLEI